MQFNLENKKNAEFVEVEKYMFSCEKFNRRLNVRYFLVV